MPSQIRFLMSLLVVLVMAVPSAFGASPGEPAADFEWFETKVRPILVDHCYTCHSADTKPAGGLRVDDRNGLLVRRKQRAGRRARRPGGEPAAAAREPQEPEPADAEGGPAADGRADRCALALDRDGAPGRR